MIDLEEIIKPRAHFLGEKVYCAPVIPHDKLKGTVEGIAESTITPVASGVRHHYLSLTTYA